MGKNLVEKESWANTILEVALVIKELAEVERRPRSEKIDGIGRICGALVFDVGRLHCFNVPR